MYVEAEKLHNKVIAEAGELLAKAQKKLLEKSENASAVTVFNSLGFERKALVTLPEGFENGALTADGAYVPTENTAGGLKALVTLPSFGAVSLVPAEKARRARKGVTVTETKAGFEMENSLVKAVVNKRGEVTSFVLKKTGREFAAGAMNRFRVFKDVPRRWDCWDIDSNYVYQEIDGAYDVKVEVAEQGIEAALKVTGKVLDSAYTQYICLAKDSKRLEFRTEVDWKELHKLLKVGFPVDVYAENAVNEMQLVTLNAPRIAPDSTIKKDSRFATTATRRCATVRTVRLCSTIANTVFP